MTQKAQALLESVLDAAQVGEILHCHAKSVKRLAIEGRIPYRIIAKRYIFTLEDVRAFLTGSATVGASRIPAADGATT